MSHVCYVLLSYILAVHLSSIWIVNFNTRTHASAVNKGQMLTLRPISKNGNDFTVAIFYIVVVFFFFCRMETNCSFNCTSQYST